MNKLFTENINLNRKDHVYKLTDNPGLDFTSVTTFIGEFFKEFNAKKIASNLVNNNIKYMHLSIEELLSQWKKAADYGTLVHEEIENSIVHGTPVKEQKSIQGIRWLNDYKMKSDFDIFSEVIVYSEALKLAGTIDLLVFDKKNKTYSIMDWKTSKRIDSKAYKNKKGIHTITSNVDDCNFNHYALQLSLYRYILETFYGLQISEHIIIHLQDNNSIGYHAPYMKNIILEMINSIEDK